MDEHLFIILIVFALFSTADREYAHHSHNPKHYPNGVHNADYDRNIIYDSFGVTDDFSKMSISDVKERVFKHLKKMDLDENNLINKHEISISIFNYFMKVDEDETKQKLLDIDDNSDDHVEWKEYLKKVYGYDMFEIEEFKKDTSQDMKSFLKLVSDDFMRFRAADLNEDEKLNLTEYGAFLHPSSYDYMHDYEINLTLSQIDRNGDGFITFDEYLGDSTPAEEQRIVDHENFKSYDANSDGRLDRKEIRVWLVPGKRALAEEEAEHLVEETDADGDGQLSVEEVVDRYEIWHGSAATHYGEGFRRDRSEL